MKVVIDLFVFSKISVCSCRDQSCTDISELYDKIKTELSSAAEEEVRCVCVCVEIEMGSKEK